MTWLLVNIVAGAAFLNIMKWGQRLRCDMAAMGAANYVVAALCFLAAGLAAGLKPHPLPLLVGGATGAVYVATYFVLDASLKRCGLGATMAVARMSVLIPTGASILFWGERPGWVQSLGIALAVAALPLLSAPRAGAPQSRGGRWAWMLLPVLFVLNGASSVSIKLSVWAAPGPGLEYLTALFVVAAAASVAVARLRPARGQPLRRGGLGTRRDLALGALLGVANVAPNFAMYAALGSVAGAIAFPVQACGTLLLTTLAAAALWRERYPRRTMAGLGLALAALALIHIRPAAALRPDAKERTPSVTTEGVRP